jgi:hypothetical protein
MAGEQQFRFTLVSTSGIVVGGESVAKYDLQSLRAVWRLNESLALRGCLGHVLVGEHFTDPENPLAATDAMLADPYRRIPPASLSLSTPRQVSRSGATRLLVVRGSSAF